MHYELKVMAAQRDQTMIQLISYAVKMYLHKEGSTVWSTPTDDIG